MEDVLMASLNKRSGIDLSRKLTSPLFLAMMKMSSSLFRFRTVLYHEVVKCIITQKKGELI